MTDDDIRSCLRQDHDQVLALARAAVAAPDAESAAILFEELRDRIERHCRAEQAVVYPAVEFLRMPSAQAVPPDCLHHFDTCERLLQALAAPSGHAQALHPQWRSLAQRLLNLLTLHVREQHRHLNPLLSHRVSAGLREELGGHYRRISADAGAAGAAYNRPLG